MQYSFLSKPHGKESREIKYLSNKKDKENENPKGNIDGPSKKENGIKLVALGAVTFHGRTQPAWGHLALFIPLMSCPISALAKPNWKPKGFNCVLT